MKEINLNSENDIEELKTTLFKGFQSANINFLFGAGLSTPAINVLGDIENIINKIEEQDFVNLSKHVLFSFLKEIFHINKMLFHSLDNGDIMVTKNNYTKFMKLLNKALINRKNAITKPSANIFTTNYDLFMEDACEQLGSFFHYNDGFRNKNKLFLNSVFEVSEFNKSINYCGCLYEHKTTLPSVNLVKLHGSVHWLIKDSFIVLDRTIKLVDNFASINIADKEKEISSIIKQGISKPIKNDFELNTQINDLLKKIAIVIPSKNKFETTVMNQVYYSLLRFLANELDRENSMLISLGFSFNDEHIKELVQKALKTNPTLQLFIFAYDINQLDTYRERFNSYNNVTVIYNDKDKLNFEAFNLLFGELIKGLPQYARN
ncbi:MAG: SIR2 family protein [bacterium]